MKKHRCKYAAHHYSKVKARIIMALLRMETPSDFMSMRRRLGIDFPFNCKTAKQNGRHLPRLPYREQTAYDECRIALNMLVSEGKILAELVNGKTTYRLDDVLMLRLKASCT